MLRSVTAADRRGGAAGGRIEVGRLELDADVEIGARRGEGRREDGAGSERGKCQQRSATCAWRSFPCAGSRAGPLGRVYAAAQRGLQQFSKLQRQRHHLGGIDHVVDADLFVGLVREIEDAGAVGDAVRAACRCGRCASGRRCRARRRIPGSSAEHLARSRRRRRGRSARRARSWSGGSSRGRAARS